MVKFYVLTLVKIWMFFWAVMLCSFVCGYQRLRATHSLCLQCIGRQT